MRRILLLIGLVLLSSGVAQSATFLPETGKAASPDLIDYLTTLPPDQTDIVIDDMVFRVSDLKRSGFTGTRWTDNIVYYEFDAAVSNARRDNWREAAFQWTCAADLTFIEGQGDGNFIHVFTGSGNWSYVGMVTGQQDMSIVSWNSIFIIAHEIGHALGQIHEQSRSDRDTYVSVHLDRVCQDCCDGGTCNHNFDIEAGSDNYGAYDFDSVMHYSQCAFNVCDDCGADLDNCRTITVLEPWTAEWQDNIGQRNHLSTLDMAGMAIRYGDTLNDPPVAMCMPFTDTADMNCCIEVSVADIDGGSYDPQGAGDVESLCITAVDGTPVDCEQTVQVCEVGDHTVTLTITDLCGETSSCDATVTVVDVTPPDVTIDLNRDVLWPPNHKMAEILVTVTAEDNCDDDPLIELVSVTSNEPDNGIGDGNTVNDIVILDDMTFMLRSERMGGGDGRIYQFTYQVTDFSGNATVSTAEVRVPHDQSGMAKAYTGFLPDGTGIDTRERTFAIVIPSVPDGITAVGGDVDVPDPLDAATIDPQHVYVGNLGGVLRPISSSLIDVDRNGMPDLVVHYSMKAMLRIPGDPVYGSEGVDGIEVDAVTENILGLHYRASDIDYLIPDIRVLGSALIVRFGEDAGNWDDGLPVEERSSLETGITSVNPNPFNPMTVIRFNVEKTSQVMLRIYDFRGNLVRELRNEIMAAGPHEVAWNGRDQSGRQVAAGIYLSLLADGRTKSTHKLVLLK